MRLLCGDPSEMGCCNFTGTGDGALVLIVLAILTDMLTLSFAYTLKDTII
jgi:hypothetical protein